MRKPGNMPQLSRILSVMATSFARPVTPSRAPPVTPKVFVDTRILFVAVRVATKRIFVNDPEH